MLVNVAEGLGAKGTICYQEEALGTAHAILCAQEALDGRTIIAFADTCSVQNSPWMEMLTESFGFSKLKILELLVWLN
jgi:bifunctional N-acetylglucosamine-1-phosphate-uridyltransferase/glucosamine-1-phosphate-acetyltransferase GlmU-like protein